VAQVFVSYKSEDRERLRPLVEALEAEGFSVWWDAQIEAGEAWRDRIEQQLESALCVVVAWTERSVGPEGRFVRDEAGRALSRGVYLPILLDPVRLPIGFGEVQALSLVGWRASRTDSRFQAVLSAIRSQLDSNRMNRASSTPASSMPAASANRTNRGIDRRVLMGGGTAALVAAGAGGWWFTRHQISGPGPGADDKSIAVLPFANLSDDPGQAYFADGLAEELRGALTRIGQIKVIARTSCEAVRNSPVTKAAKELGVARVLIGSVRRSASLIRVSAQLVDGNNGVELWSETYDRAPGDVLQIQAGIATSVADALRVRLAPAEKAALAAVDTTNAAAHDLYLQATASLRSSSSSEVSMREALRLLNAAIVADPNYVAALATRAKLAFAVADAYESGEALRNAISDSLAIAKRAVALNANSATAQSALGYLLGSNLDVAGGLERSELAYRLGPGDADAVYQYCNVLHDFRRDAEAVPLIEQAITRDPLDPRTYVLRGRLLFAVRRHLEAIESMRRAVVLRQKYDSAHSNLGDLLVLMGRPQEAIAEHQQVSNGWDRFRGLAIARARMGDRAGSDRELTELKKIDDGSLSFQFAEVHSMRGELELAISKLEAAYEALDGGLQTLYSNPLLEPVRSHPRVQALLRRLKFPV
jgi:TolB-like protein